MGLYPAVGYLHRDRPWRPSLALDIVEELRPVIADRLALSLINRRQIRRRSGGAFAVATEEWGHGDGRSDAERKCWWHTRKGSRRRFFHPFLEERVAFGIVPHVQALLLAQVHLRGDLEGYPSFLWR